jgi:hypothetical protein
MTINNRKFPADRAWLSPCMVLGLLAASAAPAALAAPDDGAGVQSVPAPGQVEQPAGSAFAYLRIAGSTFLPFDGTTTFAYPGVGCISKTGGIDSRFAHKVVLPDGALVRYLRLYYYDESPEQVTAFFTSYDGAGNFIEHASVASANAVGGFDSTLSPLIDYEVDQFASSINVVVNLGAQNDSTLQFCGVRIAYDAPIVDYIFADDFDLTPL